MYYTTVEKAPSVKEYLKFRSNLGLASMNDKDASKALSQSLYAICLKFDDKLAAMGRVVGDGASFIQVVDVYVDPMHEKEKLLSKVLEHILNYISLHLPSSCEVSIFGQTDLYAKFGFYEPKKNKGMILY